MPGDPFRDITVTETVDFVMKAGAVWNPDGVFQRGGCFLIPPCSSIRFAMMLS